LILLFYCSHTFFITRAGHAKLLILFILYIHYSAGQNVAKNLVFLKKSYAPSKKSAGLLKNPHDFYAF